MPVAACIFVANSQNVITENAKRITSIMQNDPLINCCIPQTLGAMLVTIHVDELEALLEGGESDLYQHLHVEQDDMPIPLIEDLDPIFLVGLCDKAVEIMNGFDLSSVPTYTDFGVVPEVISIGDAVAWQCKRYGIRQAWIQDPQPEINMNMRTQLQQAGITIRADIPKKYADALRSNISHLAIADTFHSQAPNATHEYHTIMNTLFKNYGIQAVIDSKATSFPMQMQRSLPAFMINAIDSLIRYAIFRTVDAAQN